MTRSVPIETRLSPESLAIIAQYYEKRLRTRSGIVRLAMDEFARALVKSGRVIPACSDEDEAIVYLREIGLIDIRQRDKSLLEAIDSAMDIGMDEGQVDEAIASKIAESIRKKA